MIEAGFHIAYLHEFDEQYKPSIESLVVSLSQDVASIFRGSAYAAVFLAWLAFFDLLGIAWNRMIARRRRIES